MKNNNIIQHKSFAFAFASWIQEFRPDNIERYARRVSMDEIEKSGYNLNISRYVSTSEDEVEINLTDVNKKLTAINDSIKQNTDKHNEYLKELGLNTI